MSLVNYKSEIPAENLQKAQEIELTRRALLREEATPATLAYARFLSAVENDATHSRGQFKPFAPDDSDIARRYPFLADLIAQEGKDRGNATVYD